MTGDDLRSRTMDSSTRSIITAAEAFALADLIDAASDNRHTECLLHDTPWGGVDTCDNLGVTPADSRRCPNCRLRDALAALEADQ